MLKYKKFKIIPELESFLRKEKLLTKFSKNINLIPKIDITLLSISSSFVFDKTPEGDAFWYNIDSKYNEYLKYCKSKK